MDRDEVAALLALPIAGVLLVLASRMVRARAGGLREDRAWARLVLPLAPASAVCALFAGWAFAGPEEAQSLALVNIVLAVPLALVLARAVARAIRSLLSTAAATEPARTAGLIRPAVIIDEAFARSLSEPELRAVVSHEEAHARHRDPLRIWIARLATDLSWPLASSGAEARFVAWARALELARDAEALAHGADPHDLANAILVAAALRSAHAPEPSASAAIANDASFLDERIHRLLDSAPPTVRASSRCLAWTWRAALASLLGVTFTIGLVYGERFLPLLAR